MHPLMEAYRADMVRLGQVHGAEKLPSRLRPLEQWCAGAGVDPACASIDQLGAFRSWLLSDYRLSDGCQPSRITVRHVLDAVRGWYRWLRANRHRDDDPASAIAVGSGRRPRQAPWLGNHPLPPAMQAFLDHVRLRARDRSATAYALALQQFLGWCVAESIDPLRLTRDQADAYLVWLSGTYRSRDGAPLKRSTVSTRISNLRSWYEWLELRGEIIANPAAKLRVRVPVSRVVVHEHLSLQEATALVQTQAAAVTTAATGTRAWAVRYRALAAICLGLATGRRAAGMASLRVDQLDCERQELRVEREKGRTGRVLPVAGWAIGVAETYLREARPLLVLSPQVPWLFPDRFGDGPISTDTLRGMLDDLMRQTIAANPDLDELPAKTISWHSLRVSFATLLFANGCPIRSVNELMLHRCLTTTAKYTPIAIDDMHRVWCSAHPRP